MVADDPVMAGVRRLAVRTEDGTDLAGPVGHAGSGAADPLVERIGRVASATIDP